MDVIEIKYMPLTNPFARPHYEGKVIEIMQRWASEPFPRKPKYIDRFIVALNGIIFDIGWIVTQYTNLWSYILNHFDRADEIRALRDASSRLFVGDEGFAEMSFSGTLWEDVKSGAVASRIKNYFVGLGEAGIGFLKGIYTLITDPKKVIEAIGNLPGTLKTLWQNRGKLWDSFVNASPDDQARMIGRFFGEVEILLATAGAGGGTSTASKSPQMATAMEIVANSRTGTAAAALSGGSAIPIDLAVLGGEGARMTSLMAVTTDAATSGKGTADELRAQEAKPGEAKPVEKPATKPMETGAQPTAPKLFAQSPDALIKQYPQLEAAIKNARSAEDAAALTERMKLIDSAEKMPLAELEKLLDQPQFAVGTASGTDLRYVRYKRNGGTLSYAEWQPKAQQIWENTGFGTLTERELQQAFDLGAKNTSKMVDPAAQSPSFIPDHVRGQPTTLEWGKAYRFEEIKDWANMSDTGNLSAMLDYVEKVQGCTLTIYYRSNTYMSGPLRTRIEALVKLGKVDLIPFLGR